MNHREPPHMPVGTRRALHCLSFLLLPALAPTAALSLPRSRPPGDPVMGSLVPESLPYLAIKGVPPLRFQRPTPPPDLVTHPAAAAPPIPKLTPTEIVVAQNNATAATSAIDTLPATPPAPEVKEVEVAPVRPRTAPTLIPDDARPPLRAEDFLPFFQIPGATPFQGGTGVPAPAAPSSPTPGMLPPSSATYTQTSK